MYSVSNNYLNALAAPVKTFRLIGTVGTVSFDESNIIDISIDNQVSEGSEIKIGSVYAGVLTATFNGLTIARGAWVGKTITLSEGLLVDADNDTYEDVPLGIFTVAEANHTAEGVEVTAYDAMTNFDKTRNDLTDTGTAYAFLTLMCQKCGVTLGSTLADIQALPNGTETFTIYIENDIQTWRDLLSWIAQTLGAVATIGRDGKLYLRQYSMTAAATIDETHRFTGCSFSDFVTYYTGMSVVDIALRQTEYKSEVVDDGLTYNLGSNPLVQGHYEYVQEIIDDFSNVALTPFNAQMLGGAIYDLCDCLTFSGGIAAGATCGVMGYTWKYNGAYSVKGFGANPALATAKSKTQKELEALYNTVGQDINEMSVVQNSTAVTIAENTETSILKYNFEVTQEENTTMVDVSVVMTSSASETEANDVYTLSDIVAHLSFYVDGSEVNVYAPEFIVDEGKDTMTFNFSLSGLSVGGHEFDIRLTVGGGSGSIAVHDVHEIFWGYGITFEVYVKSIMVAKLPVRTVFYAGQKLDYTGVQIDAVYNNGAHNDVTATSAFDPAEQTPLTLDDVGTITVDVNAIVDDVDLATSFDVMVKNGTWNGRVLYPGYRPYDALWDWLKVDDFTQGSLSVAYPGNTGLNEQDVVPFSQNWGTHDCDTVRFSGNGISKGVTPSLAPSSKFNNYKGSGCLGGVVYWWEDNGKTVFARMEADSANGLIHQDTIGTATPPSGKTFWAYSKMNAGVTVPVYAGSDNNDVYDKRIYALNSSDGTVTKLGEFAESTNKCVNSVVLDDGTEYHLFGQCSTSVGGDKYLIQYKDGELSIHTLAIPGKYEHMSMQYDATNDVLVAYFGNKTYNNPNYTYETKCYQIDRTDFSVTEVNLPNYLIIETIDNSGDASHSSYDTAEAVVLLNGTTDGRTAHDRITYNGRICIDDPVTMYDYGYFDPTNGKRTPQQFLMLKGWNSYNYYWNQNYRICYIDNLYYQQSNDNKIFLNVFHSL